MAALCPRWHAGGASKSSLRPKLDVEMPESMKPEPQETGILQGMHIHESQEASEQARLLEANVQSFEQEMPKETAYVDEKKRFRRNATQLSLVCVCLLLTTAMVVYTFAFKPSPGFVDPATGSAIVFVHDKEMLLVHRNDTGKWRWGLPGEVRDVEEGLLVPEVTATATSELGVLSPYTFNAEFTYSLGIEDEQRIWIFVTHVSDKKGFVLQGVPHGHKYSWTDIKKLDKMKDLDPLLDSLINEKSARQKLSVALRVSDPKKPAVPTTKKVKVEKLGAGLFLKAEGDILLLQKNSSNNNGTWTVPGGNTDLTDEHLRHTAEREAVEEMGICPKYTYKGEVDTKRSNGKKVFKLFLGTLATELRYNFTPKLSVESLDWGWFPLDTLHKRKDLHPVVKILVNDHAKEVKKIFGK